LRAKGQVLAEKGKGKKIGSKEANAHEVSSRVTSTREGGESQKGRELSKKPYNKTIRRDPCLHRYFSCLIRTLLHRGRLGRKEISQKKKGRKRGQTAR